MTEHDTFAAFVPGHNLVPSFYPGEDDGFGLHDLSAATYDASSFSQTQCKLNQASKIPITKSRTEGMMPSS